MGLAVSVSRNGEHLCIPAPSHVYIVLRARIRYGDLAWQREKGHWRCGQRRGWCFGENIPGHRSRATALGRGGLCMGSFPLPIVLALGGPGPVQAAGASLNRARKMTAVTPVSCSRDPRKGIKKSGTAFRRLLAARSQKPAADVLSKKHLAGPGSSFLLPRRGRTPGDGKWLTSMMARTPGSRKANCPQSLEREKTRTWCGVRTAIEEPRLGSGSPKRGPQKFRPAWQDSGSSHWPCICWGGCCRRSRATRRQLCRCDGGPDAAHVLMMNAAATCWSPGCRG